MPPVGLARTMKRQHWKFAGRLPGDFYLFRLNGGPYDKVQEISVPVEDFHSGRPLVFMGMSGYPDAMRYHYGRKWKPV